MTFGGSTIFGTQVSQNGPGGEYRAQDSLLPGVDGARIYRLGKGPKVWTVSGRLFATTLAGLTGAVENGLSFKNGRLYTFVDVGGTAYLNCQLTDFHPIGHAEACTVAGTQGVTLRVAATVRQLAP